MYILKHGLTFSGAIGLAAKSAGIIPGSPCRELGAGGPCRELGAGGPCSLLDPEPAAHAGPQTQFLQEGGTGVSSERDTTISI